MKAGAGPSSCVSLRLLLGEFRSVFLSFVLALFALGIWCLISFVPVSGSHCSGRLGIAEEYGKFGLFGRCLFPLVQCFTCLREALGEFLHFLRGGRLES